MQITADWKDRFSSSEPFSLGHPTGSGVEDDWAEGCSRLQPVSSIYIWSKNLVAQSEASFVLTAHTKTIERDWN